MGFCLEPPITLLINMGKPHSRDNSKKDRNDTRQKKNKRVPVVDDKNRLVGIVSRGDIVRIVCEEPLKNHFLYFSMR